MGVDFGLSSEQVVCRVPCVVRANFRKENGDLEDPANVALEIKPDWRPSGLSWLTYNLLGDYAVRHYGSDPIQLYQPGDASVAPGQSRKDSRADKSKDALQRRGEETWPKSWTWKRPNSGEVGLLCLLHTMTLTPEPAQKKPC